MDDENAHSLSQEVGALKPKGKTLGLANNLDEWIARVEMYGAGNQRWMIKGGSSPVELFGDAGTSVFGRTLVSLPQSRKVVVAADVLFS